VYNSNMAILDTSANNFDFKGFQVKVPESITPTEWINVLDAVLNKCDYQGQKCKKQNYTRQSDGVDVYEPETPEEEYNRIFDSLNFDIDIETPDEEHGHIMKSIDKIYPELTKVDDNYTMISSAPFTEESKFDDSELTILTSTTMSLPKENSKYNKERDEWIEQARREAEESTKKRVMKETISKANYLRVDLKNTKRNKMYTNISLGCSIFSIIFWPFWFLRAAIRYMLDSHTMTGNVIFGITALVCLTIFAFGMMSIQKITKRSRQYKTQIAKTKSALYKLDDSFLSDKEVEDKYKFRENDDACGELDEE